MPQIHSSENIFTGLVQQKTLLKVCKESAPASRIVLESEILPDVSKQLKSLLKWQAEPFWNVFTQWGLATGRCESSFSVWFMQFSVCTKNQYTHFANQEISIGPVH